ncbi:MAG TPA: hypothetical protein VLF66_13135, partial [Thermoanaerobaculia bacterium]|nr:hypothetical protein [Thermoanaerobaculia bacterium]
KVDLRAAEKLLDALPASSGLPLEDLLRARLAAAQGSVRAAEDHYERARTRGIDHDGLRLELARTLATLGDSIGAGVVFTQLAEMGSRLAEAHDARARLWVLEGEPGRGEPYLELGWRLEPILREDLFADPLLSVLCARPSLFPTFSFGRPEEPLVESLERGLRPVRLPRSASAGLSGELLRIEVGGAELYVPGGGELAPGEALPETAADRLRREEGRILARLPELVEEARTPAILTRPGRTRQLVEASFALARRNRWQEIVELTEGVAQVVGQAPGPVTQLRAAALHRTERTGEARDLLVRLAQSSVATRRRDPGTFSLLAELLVASQDYDRALQMMRKAASMSPMARNEHRVRQVSMEQRLYEDPETFETEHFDIVYPRTTSVEHAADLAGVLEAEVERLGRWIPASPGTIHTVHLYPLIEFLEAYSENVLVLGIYDGRLRVPLADLRSLHPRLVAVLSHELAHAMVAAATDDQAPKWFQEGLAQHVEMVPGRLNPIPDLHREGRILAFPMIEGILDGFSEPQLVDLAYGEAAWVVHYIEAEHGVGAIRKLIGAFAGGRTTEEALQEVFRMSVEEFDRAVWDWCLREAPAAWEAPARRRYEEEYSRYLRPSDRTVPGLPAPDAAMASWHAVYGARTRQVKALLGSVVAPIRSGGDPPRETCATLVSGLAGVLEDPEALAAPEAALRRELEAAYRSLGQAAWHCREGGTEEARVALAQAELALGRAAQKLAPYGLRP